MKPVLKMSCIILLALFVIIQTASAQGTPSSGKNSSERFVSIDFKDVDITLFIKFISELTGKNFIVDQRVKGKVTIISPSKISVDEAYAVFESVLEVHGFATVVSGEVTKIIAAPEARTKNIETLFKEESVSPEDKVVTQLIPLRYADPNEIKKIFTPLISRNSVLLSYDPTNMLIITDVYSNINRLLKILKTIDVEGIGQELSVTPVIYADAVKLVQTLGVIFKTQKPPQRGQAVQQTIFVADDRTNSVIMVGSEDETKKVKNLIQLLDKEIPKGKDNIHVYYLENATAEDLAKVIQSLSTKAAAPTQKDPGQKEAPIVSEKTFITADKATNSLIIMASKEDYMVLEEIIKKLDAPRSMVYIECLIMEVNVDKGFSVGTEWMAAGKTDVNDRDAAFGGGFSGGDSGYSNLLKMMTPTASLPGGSWVAMVSEPLKIGDIVFPNLGAVVQAFRKDKNVNILSTPQVLTTDNQEASITIGKNVPYQTKSGTTSTSESYNTYEYKDVGITLKITPQISKDRQIRLKIFQEVTKLDTLPTSRDERPTTLKRSIDTTVVVNNKNTIAIGGLIDDSFSDTQYKVPCFGDMPGIGWLFKSLSRSREKTNLFVFLTPHVIETSEDAEKFYQEKKEQINQIDPGTIKLYQKGDKTKENLEPIMIQ